ncbi:hypothetical protein LXL04_030415 [Taraxacum kok-saghyz]
MVSLIAVMRGEVSEKPEVNSTDNCDGRTAYGYGCTEGNRNKKYIIISISTGEFTHPPSRKYVQSSTSLNSNCTQHIFTLRSFENSYIPENPRTNKPLTFSKNRLRGAKNRSNTSPVANFFFEKTTFFFFKNFAYVQIFFFSYVHIFLSLNNTYLKGFVKKNLKKNAKKKCTYAKIKKKFVFSEFFFATGLVFERFLASRSRSPSLNWSKLYCFPKEIA